jgi:hypothetical protein
VAEPSESEKRLRQLVSPELDTSLLLMREALERLWAPESPRIISDFTDHGVSHIQRLAAFAENILKANRDKPLTVQEMYLLLGGIYLHDIGMQCDVRHFPQILTRAKRLIRVAQKEEPTLDAGFKSNFTATRASDYSVDEQKEIRRNHQFLSAAWIQYAVETSETLFGLAARSIPPSLISDLMNVCTYHTKRSIDVCPEAFELDVTGRLRLVAALLRFSDELDIDGTRVKMSTVETYSMDPRNSVFWWLHNATKIQFDPYKVNVIHLSVSLHPSDFKKYGAFVQDLSIGEFRNKNHSVMEVLVRNGFPISIAPESKVSPYQYATRFPTAIIKVLDEMQQPKALLATKAAPDDPRESVDETVRRLFSVDPSLQSVQVVRHGDAVAYQVVQNRNLADRVNIIKEQKGLSDVPIIHVRGREEVLPSALANTEAAVVGISETGRAEQLVCGIEIQNYDSDARNSQDGRFLRSMGTLGCFVRLKTGESALLSSATTLTGGSQGICGKDRILQPSKMNVGRGDQIATLHEYLQPRPSTDNEGIQNEVDAGVAVLLPGLEPMQGYLPARRLPRLAGTAAVALPDDGGFIREKEVFKVGRTTGLTYGQIELLQVDAMIPYPNGDCLFSNLIGIRGADGRPFSGPGDSGAVVVRVTSEVIGLIVAYSDRLSFACPIDRVLELLDCELL